MSLTLTMQSGESRQIFAKPDHSPVFVRKTREGYTLMYADSGEPTDGNQYVVLPAVKDMKDYLQRNGYKLVK